MIQFLTENALALSLEDESVDLIITHPPYIEESVGRFGGDDSLQINASNDRQTMLRQLRLATREMYRVLKPGGNLVIANSTSDRFDSAYVSQVISAREFVYLDTVVQNSYGAMESGEPEFKTIDRNCLTYWYHFRKPSEELTDNVEFIRNEKFAGMYSNPVWNLRFNNLDSIVDQKLSETYFMLDSMNSEVARRFIEMFTIEGDVVLDPFGGSGIVAVTASLLGRFGITNDIAEEQTHCAIERWTYSKVG